MGETTKQILVEARGLIEDEANWIKGRNRDGNCFCAFGAVLQAARAFGPNKWQAAEQALNKQCRVMFGELVFGFNDAKSTTHADILSLFDKAIEAAG